MMCPELATILEGDGGTRDNSGAPRATIPPAQFVGHERLEVWR